MTYAIPPPPLPMPRRARNLLEEELGLSFRDKGLLRLSLTHGSYIHEHPSDQAESNERLEFLGDAVVGLVIGEDLYRRFPHEPEGVLTMLRAGLVRAETLAAIASSMELGHYLHLGRGEEQSGGRSRERNLARALEALCGAFFLDQGFEEAKTWILSLFEERLEALPEDTIVDYKSLLQEAVQALGSNPPLYRTIRSEGPDHQKDFTVEAVVDNDVLGRGVGPSKRKAQREAAQAALAALARRDPDALESPPLADS